MRICIDMREFDRHKITGIGRYLMNFVKFIDENKGDNEFILFCNQDININDYGKNLKKILISKCPNLYWEQLQLPRFLKKERVDLFFSPYYKMPFFAPCKTVITIHDLIPLFYSEKTLYTLYFAKLGKVFAHRANVVITDSQHSKEDIVHNFKVPPEKIRVVHLGVEERFHPINSHQQLNIVKQKYGISKRYILFLGNLKPHKNVAGLLKAYGSLPVDFKNKFELVIAGNKDKNFERIYQLVKKLSLEENVIFTDFVGEEDLPILYGAAELFVMPSLCEGFGLPALEAMACGTPVVVSKAASLPEVVGEAGLYVNPLDTKDITRKLEKILSDESLRKDLSNKGIEQAKKFKIEYSVNKILSIFQEVFNEKS